jgi:hypothetical protein|tara:strand:+ start:207 stop:320 length:114 start_codon:yes stop_codon:yes gene_type:complete
MEYYQYAALLFIGSIMAGMVNDYVEVRYQRKRGKKMS